jgi:hypothetical protein
MWVPMTGFCMLSHSLEKLLEALLGCVFLRNHPSAALSQSTSRIAQSKSNVPSDIFSLPLSFLDRL